MGTPHSTSHDWLSPTPRKHAYLEPAHFDHRTALEAFSSGLGPVKAMALSQMELLTLTSRRMQAYMAIPTRLARCRTRQDLLEEQMRFWHTAMDQYQESASRIFQAWSDVWGFKAFLPMPAGSAGDNPHPEPGEHSGLIHLPVVNRAKSADGESSRHPAPAKVR